MLACDADWTHKDVKANGEGKFYHLGKWFKIVSGQPCPFPTCPGTIQSELKGGQDQSSFIIAHK